MSGRTADEEYDILVTAIKANRECKQQREDFSLLRATIVAKHIEPEFAQNAAISLIDCFHALQSNPLDAGRRRVAIDCLKRGGHCEQEIKDYLS